MKYGSPPRSTLSSATRLYDTSAYYYTDEKPYLCMRYGCISRAAFYCMYGRAGLELRMCRPA